MSKEMMTMIRTVVGGLPRARSAPGPRIIGVAVAVACTLALGTGPAVAATPSPGWAVDSFAQPTNFAPGDSSGNDTYVVTATNAGSLATSGAPTLSDDVPAGLTIQSVGSSVSWGGGGLLCTHTSTHAQCTLSALGLLAHPSIAPDEWLQMVVHVAVAPDASGVVTDQASVSGGGAPTVSASAQNQASSATPPFGVASFGINIAGVDGLPDTQAGAHPYELTTRIDLANQIRSGPNGVADTSVEDPKDAVVDLPLGFMGSAVAAPTCTFAQLDATSCPADTVVGHIRTEPGPSLTSVDSPLYNMVPEHGVTAEFGYHDMTNNTHVLYASVVPTATGYVLRTTSPDIPEVNLTDIVVTFYGDPAQRDGTGNAAVPMFTNPTDCSAGPLVTSVYIDSWQHPGSVNPDGSPNLSDRNWVSATSTSPPVTGCNQLEFQPSMVVQPDATVADSPSGLHVDISVPQSENPSTLATPPLKDASVMLPPGFTVNPSSAAGLQACTPAQIALGSATPPSCPAASQIGTVQLQTPLIPGTLQGQIYLASEFDNPFHALLAGYIVVNDPTTGVVIKIPGNLTPNPVTGQITGVFDNNPQFPFSDLKLDFKGGPTGVIATSESCGSFTTSSVFSPWSFPDSGPAATPSDRFQITSGCVSGFSPSLMAGVQNAQAGRFSPFVVSLSRSDTDQNFEGLTVKLPPGMLAKLAGVQECSEQQLASISSAPGSGASQLANPSCPAGSQVGSVQTGSGVGPNPFFLGGKAYLTGPYKGAPYGLAVVVPAVAGPLDLGSVVVRQALYIDPTTAQATDVSDPFPTILDGIPLRIRRIDVTLNRSNFTVNPTSCNPMAVTGTATSTQGTNANLNARFQVGGCQDLAFSPKLRIALSGKGKTHSGNHPTLTATLTQPGGQANLRQAKVALPLSMALDVNNSKNVCAFATAQAVHGGSVGCPASTVVGSATAKTPLLSQPLTGKVYLVQGIRFGKNGQPIHTLPSLLIPLRGQIALDLRAQSAVSGGKLVTTFATIPDAPVSKFTLKINGGRKGILVITGRGKSICGKKQVSNATFGAQSGKSKRSAIKMSTPCRATKSKKKSKAKTGGPRKKAAGDVLLSPAVPRLRGW